MRALRAGFPLLIVLGGLLAAGLGSGIAARAADPPADSGEDSGVQCGTPYEHDSGNDGGNHESPENTPYFLEDFDSVQNCVACHPDHYDEWHGSIHAYSATNPVMWKGSEEIGETTDSPLVCIGCHAPVATLVGTLSATRVVSEKAQLPEVAQSGVSCVSCHKLYDVYNGVNQFTHCKDYYFGPIEDAQPTSYHGNDHSPIHRQALVCRSCHNVENLNQVQVEFTYSEWLDANEAAGGEEFAPAIQTCQDCHMQAYTGTAAVGGPERTVHRHTFVGGDVALTPFPDSHRQYRAVQDLMRTAGDIAITPLYVGRTFSGVDVAVTNTNEGHDLPSGAAFDRQVWVELVVTDANGEALLESGTLDANGDLRDWNSSLEPESDPWITTRRSVFRSYLSDETGAETFDFIGRARFVRDESLVAGETRWVEFTLAESTEFLDGAPLALPLTIEARLLYRPFPPFLLRAHGLDESLVAAIPIFEIARDNAVVE